MNEASGEETAAAVGCARVWLEEGANVGLRFGILYLGF